MAKPKPQPLHDTAAVTDPGPKQLFLQLTVPAHVFDAYATDAEARGISFTQLATETLIKAREGAGRSGFYLTNAEREELNKLAGRNVLTAAELLVTLRRMSSVVVDGVECPLEPTLLARLQSRAPVNGDFAAYVRDTVRHQLAQFVGIA